MSQKILGVLGPTASGKTALGIALALRFGGEIVSLDSRQIYRGLDIGTGKDLFAYAAHPDLNYHLIDIIPPEGRRLPISLVQWLHHARSALDDVASRGRVPVLVGGTHLYWRALLEEFAPPEAPPDRAFRAAARWIHRDRLAAELRSRFPALASVTDIANQRRVIRALEIGMRLGDVAPPRSAGVSERFDPFLVRVTTDREALHERIRTRLLARFDQGMLGEVQRLLGNGVRREFLDALGLEYAYCARCLSGELPFNEMAAGLHTAICRFAKAQETWIRGLLKRGWPMTPHPFGGEPEGLFPAIEEWLSAAAR